MSKEKKNLKALIALSLIPGLGNRKAFFLLRRFREASEIFKQSKASLKKVEGIGESTCLAILSFKDWQAVDRMYEQSLACGAQLIGYHHDMYPQSLRHIYNPPLLLWCLGNPEVLSEPGVAIVGTRMPSSYGRSMAELISKSVVEKGYSVISGLAFGIDTIAHREAVSNAGSTVAVLGSGINVLYPRQNAVLAERIIGTGGAIITEFPPDTKPDAGNFPVRNRIVSGLSQGVVVIESGVQGGSLITAELALDQSKEVFAVPHRYDNVKGNGCNYLIKTGQAKLIQSPHDIFEELPRYREASDSDELQNEDEKVQTGWREAGLDALSKQICEKLEAENHQLDQLAELLGMDTNKLLVQMLGLEMQGFVRQKAGKIFELR
jgi:DNA processing protein